MSFEDNSAVVALIEGAPNGLLTLLSEECFFPNGSDAGWLGKIKEIHRKHPNFEEYRQNKDCFTVMHYPGKVTYDAMGFLDKNKDPLAEDLQVFERMHMPRAHAACTRQEQDLAEDLQALMPYVAFLTHLTLTSPA